ncbi:hypothetical protein [Cellulomonas sp. URHE0023]|uniref:hypothetical protein n=1 Tax=Cellulomonas sp. URHE0023 TaxID=1380354 RepID=UPI0012DE8F52|nr:hypothetical protein [Cellulomonas sp. URHE0023]
MSTSTARTTQAPSATPTPSATPSPSPTATVDPLAGPTVAPAQQLDAGQVGDGVPAQVQGSGDVAVTYLRNGELAVVVTLDCSACTGPTALTAPGRRSAFGSAEGPLTGSYLMDPIRSSDPNQSVWLQAAGSWTLRFESWNDLPVVSGPQSGSGSAVLRIADTATTAQVSWTPAGPGDKFSGRSFGTVSAGPPQLFGDTQAFTEVVDVAMPGALAIATNGTWTVTPIP